MGLSMRDLHAPTVASGETSGPGAASEGGDGDLMKLMEERDRVQRELFALGAVLESHNVDMNTSLTTPDGFPRNDLDVAQIRTTRAQIIRLKNDYKALMSKIEVGLHKHWATQKGIEATADDESSTASRTRMGTSARSAPPAPASPPASSLRAFAKVNSVAPGGPAATSGLLPGDRVLRFGEANWMNHEKLSLVAQTVQGNEGRSIVVKVSRDSRDGRVEEKTFTLTPRRGWGGAGLLGCHLTPLSEPSR